MSLLVDTPGGRLAPVNNNRGIPLRALMHHLSKPSFPQGLPEPQVFFGIEAVDSIDRFAVILRRCPVNSLKYGLASNTKIGILR